MSDEATRDSAAEALEKVKAGIKDTMKRAHFHDRMARDSRRFAGELLAAMREGKTAGEWHTLLRELDINIESAQLLMQMAGGGRLFGERD